jgi:enoyl-CoA hydratase
MDRIDFEGLTVGRERNLGRITLDRPKALNALTLTMVRGLHATLQRWQDDPDVAVVVLDGAGDRAFCAGGDVKSIFEADRTNGNPHARTFWREEYALDHTIATYPKPIVVLMGGIVMGGGAGLAVNARFRVVDENAIFAMPETAIGLIPDVGGSRFLSQMPGETGTYLGLTGRTIDGAQMIAGRLADAYVPRRNRANLLDGFDEVTPSGSETFAAVADVIAASAVPITAAPIADGVQLDRIFAGDEVETILKRLAADGSEWANRTLEVLAFKSPTSMKLTLRALREARRLPSLAATLQMEFRVVCRIAAGVDFYEGVRAAVIDKDRNPKWQPTRLEDVSAAAVDAYFAPLGDDELRF